MKNLFYIPFLIILVLNCKKTKSNPGTAGSISDTITKTIFEEEIIENKRDTIIKKSESFKLNNILCYWEHSFYLYDGILQEVSMKLKEYKTERLLFENSDYVKYEADFEYKSENYFDEINKKHFKDVNFDGYKDFVIYSHGSMPMTSMTNIYLFDNQTKTFVRSEKEHEDLSDNSIEEIDSVNRILVTSSFDRGKTYERKHHFDNNGKIKFTECFTEEFYYANDTIEKRITTYIKLIKGKEVETKTDTVKLE